MDYRGKYLIYEDGRIFSLIRNKYLNPSINASGYYVVSIYVDGIKKQFKVHELVANSFIPNPNNKEAIHHIDGNKLNNSVSNLMWVTNEEHSAMHRDRTSRVYVYTEETRKKMSISAKNKPPMSDETKRKISEARKGVPQTESHKRNRAEGKKIPVCQYDMENNLIKKWKSALDAELGTNISRCHIASVCKGSRKTAGGYKWKYGLE